MSSDWTVFETDTGGDGSLTVGKKTGYEITASWSPDETPMERWNINTATKKELVLCLGLRPKVAKRIIQGRNFIGAMVEEEDLLNVRGFGKKTLERLRPRIKF